MFINIYICKARQLFKLTGKNLRTIVKFRTSFISAQISYFIHFLFLLYSANLIVLNIHIFKPTTVLLLDYATKSLNPG